MDAFISGDRIPVLSELTLRELEGSPAEVRRLLGRVPRDHSEVLRITQPAKEFADAYIAEGTIGARTRADATHTALASISRVDVLVSWNFRHIVNLRRIHAYNAVNSKRGYPMLEIRSPLESSGDDGSDAEVVRLCREHAQNPRSDQR